MTPGSGLPRASGPSLGAASTRGDRAATAGPGTLRSSRARGVSPADRPAIPPAILRFGTAIPGRANRAPAIRRGFGP